MSMKRNTGASATLADALLLQELEQIDDGRRDLSKRCAHLKLY